MKQLILIMSLMTWNVYAQLPGFDAYQKWHKDSITYFDKKVTYKVGDTLVYEIALPSSEENFVILYEESKRVLNAFNHPFDSIFYATPDEETMIQRLNEPGRLFYEFTADSMSVITWFVRDPIKPNKKFLRLYLALFGDELWLTCERIKWSDYEKWLEED